ncbi:MAG: hydroxyacylglutathione hydrolase [Methanosaeta sp. PtaB.Bin018]|jgi:glyoxylase-like metal-dependent hydrolase (beta-lactamase superfamily II)|nr:MAG: hydroxyacylglutathione hydrolase [Methanosaeta sp. PtaB.Bin018]OPY47633.1 MAG: hydroxyacylglutathione hydrolase [Methanosaeta sp. PtaU1.Bin016]
MTRAKAICDRVYAVGGPELSASEDAYVYLVDAGSELVLIDSGVGYGTKRIEDNIRSLGFEPAQIWHIIATHCHIDHTGGLSDLKERYGSKVIAHAMDRAGIEGENDDLTAASMYGVNYKPVKVDTLLSGEDEQLMLGDLMFNLLHTPGHTPGSISVYIDTDDGRVLFGQDIHGPFSPLWGSDLAMWRQSMQKLLALHADVLCEGHAGIYKGEKIKKYIESYLKRYPPV